MRTIPNTAQADFTKNGYAVFPEVLEPGELPMLREVCDELLREPPDDDKGGKAHNIGRGHDRRFLRHRHGDFPALADFILGPEMKDFTARFIGATPHLFNEQFVVKGPRTGASFAWHQDGAYVGFAHKPYLSVWIALDDSSVENGTVHVLPRDLSAGMDLVPHHWDEAGKEKIGYDGPDPGIPAIVPAGSMVIFSSVTLHRSSPNTTNHPRRAYLAQYSPEPIHDPQPGTPKHFATPL